MAISSPAEITRRTTPEPPSEPELLLDSELPSPLELWLDSELPTDSEWWLEPPLDSDPPPLSELEPAPSGSERLIAERGGSSVRPLLTPITLQVAGPTTPSVLSP